MKGSAGIPELQLTTLNKLVEKFPTAPSLTFTNMFSDIRAESDSIEWEVEYGSAGMTPFVAPGAVAPKVGRDGIGSGSVKVAYMKEAGFLDESVLNNLRAVGTDRGRETGQRQVARLVQKLRNRMDRRREWMISKAILHGGFEYLVKGGTRITVSYGVPETHIVTLATDRKWDAGTNKNILEDVLVGNEVLRDDAGIRAKYNTLNSTLLRTLMLDSTIQGLLKKSEFGNGDLFQNPAAVIGSLMGVGPLNVFDDFSEIDLILTGSASIGDTVISVSHAEDVSEGATVRFYNDSKANTWEDKKIASVQPDAGTITLTTGLASAYTAGVDSVRVRDKIVKDNEFIMWSDVNADGMKIAENMLAPFGLGRNYGVTMDTDDQFDPEGTTVRIQNKSLPVVYHPDCMYKMIVY
jgi:hypothetical protein